MRLASTYLGFDLPHPIIPGAGPLTDNLDTVRHLQDAGAPMIVLRSLFGEQVGAETAERSERGGKGSGTYRFTPHEYLEHVRLVRLAVNESIPVVASLNVIRLGEWIRYVRLVDEAGADAIELNVYTFPADTARTGDEVDREVVGMVAAVCGETNIPVAVKLMPSYSSLANFAMRLSDAGARAVILFNRLYQPDIDIDQQRQSPQISLSQPGELMMRLRWAGILSGRVNLDLAVTGGVHTAEDCIKAIMCGASAVQIMSALLQRGPQYLAEMRIEMDRWLESHGHGGLNEIRGSTSLVRFPDPEAFERSFYSRMLQSF